MASFIIWWYVVFYLLVLASGLPGKVTKNYSAHQPSSAVLRRNTVGGAFWRTFGRLKNLLSKRKKAQPAVPTNRIMTELMNMIKNPPSNCKVLKSSNLQSWTISITGPALSIYSGESFKLKFVFHSDYPHRPPSVYFLKPVPKHVHIYSNGDICLNLLGQDWRPNFTCEGILVSILSMLSSAKSKRGPNDDSSLANTDPGQQQEGWMYHDDKC